MSAYNACWLMITYIDSQRACVNGRVMAVQLVERLRQVGHWRLSRDIGTLYRRPIVFSPTFYPEKPESTQEMRGKA